MVSRGYAQAHVVVAKLRSLRTSREFAALLRKLSDGEDSKQCLRAVYRIELAELVRNALRVTTGG